MIQALGVVAAVGAAMLPGLEDALAEGLTGDELCAINPGLHSQPAAEAMVGNAPPLVLCAIFRG
jgi:hypothetical protein